MNIKNKNFAFASLAFLCCICLCGFFNYITLTFLDNVEIHDTKRSILLFLVYFFQVQMALVSIYYGFRLWPPKDDDDDVQFFLTSDKTPDKVSSKDIPEVIFLTTDGCLFNGHYHADKKLFCGYDGLDFPLNEVFAWCIQTWSMVKIEEDSKPSK